MVEDVLGGAVVTVPLSSCSGNGGSAGLNARYRKWQTRLYNFLEPLGAPREGLLTVMPITGCIIVKGPLTGKRRFEPYVLTVGAQDKGDSPLFSDIDINVYVGDITPNAGVPTFVKPSFDEKAFIAEEAPVGSIVFQALAIDSATPNGRLTYKFHVDGTLGSVAITPFSKCYGGPLQFSVLEQVDPGWCVDSLKSSGPDQGENAATEYLIIFGEDAGVFTLKRNPDNFVRLLV
ncbi:hypothetical protein DAPPUDRAFT_323397 [Daphnia pulex]|uniref:Cadherin domain-containing protein n=1 Tax=Daphnia pulex TaxID=6669 RepID=E9GYS2_DAPPU|nr:hypothetical protein DAPPUDRAFT_323397 [Daphnia pulex]|eukprot:EFX75211.1 hypothetical protein DAPPUDRAFT_323397 [Daphnia pulex]